MGDLVMPSDYVGGRWPNNSVNSDWHTLRVRSGQASRLR
jgi:hypothetical protein